MHSRLQAGAVGKMYTPHGPMLRNLPIDCRRPLPCCARSATSSATTSPRRPGVYLSPPSLRFDSIEPSPRVGGEGTRNLRDQEFGTSTCFRSCWLASGDIGERSVTQEQRSTHVQRKQCDYCQRSFGLILHRYFRMRFCTTGCLRAYQRRLDELTKTEPRRFGLPVSRPAT